MRVRLPCPNFFAHAIRSLKCTTSKELTRFDLSFRLLRAAIEVLGVEEHLTAGSLICSMQCAAAASAGCKQALMQITANLVAADLHKDGCRRRRSESSSSSSSARTARRGGYVRKKSALRRKRNA